jgi:hypothetical protein
MKFSFLDSSLPQQFASVLCELWILQPAAAKSTTHTTMGKAARNPQQLQMQNTQLTHQWARQREILNSYKS